MRINVAIDGPSAAGKSTISDLLAEKLGYVHLDTGAMYRCIGLKALNLSLSPDDEAALKTILPETRITMNQNKEVFLDGRNVTDEIRSERISDAASRVSKHESVRRELVKRQQELAKEKGYILDGRDIGTVVLPDAEVKIFLTASAHARALRRYKQNLSNGIPTSDVETIEKEIEERDYRDTHRENSPLKQADDAVCVDTSEKTIEEVVQLICGLILPKIQEEVHPL